MHHTPKKMVRKIKNGIKRTWHFQLKMPFCKLYPPLFQGWREWLYLDSFLRWWVPGFPLQNCLLCLLVTHRNHLSLHHNSNVNFAHCTVCRRKAQGGHQIQMNSPKPDHVWNEAEAGALGLALPLHSGNTPIPLPSWRTTARNTLSPQSGWRGTSQLLAVMAHSGERHFPAPYTFHF